MKKNKILPWKSLLLLVLLVLIPLSTMGEETVKTNIDDYPGYTKPIILPEKGLSKEEKEHLEGIRKINAVFTREKDLEEIFNKLNLICAVIAGGELTNSYIIIDMQSARGIGKNKCIIEITVRFPMQTERGKKFGCQFFIHYPRATDSVLDRRISRIHATPPNSKYDTMECHFYDNGQLHKLLYRNSNFAQVGEEKTWLEDGTFQGTITLDKPRPFVIQK